MAMDERTATAKNRSDLRSNFPSSQFYEVLKLRGHPMSSKNHVEHVPCTSAEDFLNAISPRSKYLEKGIVSSSHFYIYRGHADDRWKLVPKALRLGERINHPEKGWGKVIISGNNNTPVEKFFNDVGGETRGT